LIARPHTFSLNCPSCGGTVIAEHSSRKITCSFCGNDLVVDPQSAVGKAVSIQSLLNIPGDLRLLEERKGLISHDVARLQKKIKTAEGEGFYTGLRMVSAIILFILIYLYGSTFLGTIIHYQRIDVPRSFAILFTLAPLIALFFHNFAIIAWTLPVLPIIGIITAQAQLAQVPNETREELEEKLTALSGELFAVNAGIREHQKTIELYRDIVPRLVG